MKAVTRTQTWLGEVLAAHASLPAVRARTLRRGLVLAVVGAHARAAAEARGLVGPGLRGAGTPAALAGLVAELGPFADAAELWELSTVAPSEAFHALLEGLPEDVDEDGLGPLYEALVELAWGDGASEPGGASVRRKRGTHYTPRSLAEDVAERALRPLLERCASGADVLALRVLDPAVGGGVFLLAATRLLASALEALGEPHELALAAVVSTCLRGVDRDPLALRVAEASVALLAGRPALRGALPEGAFVEGDTILGPGLGRLLALHLDPPRSIVSAELAATLRGLFTRAPTDAAARQALATVGDLFVTTALGAQPKAREAALYGLPAAVERLLAGSDGGAAEERIRALHHAHGRPAHLEVAFADVAARGGFDAVLGNPPWIAYSGRAAHPIPDALREWLSAISPAFHGFRTLHGLFILRSAEVLRPGGRLGLLVPTSVSDLAGYAPTRRAHDTLATCDEPLVDIGDAFEGVFQPCMLLSSTRLAERREPPEAPWALERPDLDDVTKRLLARLAALPRLPAALFGERGYQSLPSDKGAFGPPGSGPTAIRVGGDVFPFEARPPSLACDPDRLAGRLRTPETWAEVRLFLRQTARYPLVALADGLAFRNSILAGFEDASWPAPALLAYLNSSPLRFLHYVSQRDARQGMPQLKIGHLRSLPTLSDPAARAALAALGQRLGARNTGIAEEEQDALDTLVSDALGLTPEERERVAVFRRSVKG